MYNVRNPVQVGIFGGIQVESYDGNGGLVDRGDGVEGFGVTARMMDVNNVAITNTNNVVYGLT